MQRQLAFRRCPSPPGRTYVVDLFLAWWVAARAPDPPITRRAASPPPRRSTPFFRPVKLVVGSEGGDAFDARSHGGGWHNSSAAPGPGIVVDQSLPYGTHGTLARSIQYATDQAWTSHIHGVQRGGQDLWINRSSITRVRPQPGRDGSTAEDVRTGASEAAFTLFMCFSCSVLPAPGGSGSQCISFPRLPLPLRPSLVLFLHGGHHCVDRRARYAMLRCPFVCAIGSLAEVET
jgi:hypothetical protein